MTVTPWYWIRHAPVRGHKGRLYGQMDLPADCSDTAPFDALAPRLPDDALWLVTPLRRTRETLAALAAARSRAGLKAPNKPEAIAAFAEQDFGQWTDATWDEMRARDPEAYARFWEHPIESAPPGGESFKAVIDRVAAGIETATTLADGRSVVCVAHAGSIRAALAVALDLPLDKALATQIDNLSLTRLDHLAEGLQAGKGVWRVVEVNWLKDRGP
ncbi:MAG: histidine phosphatase family protein [Rhodospirillales bacterium]